LTSSSSSALVTSKKQQTINFVHGMQIEAVVWLVGVGGVSETLCSVVTKKKA